MTNTKSSSSRLPPKVASAKDLLKPITRGSAMKHSAAGTKASSIDSSKLATAAARQIDSMLGNHDSTIKPILTNKFSVLSDTSTPDLDTQTSDIPNGQASPTFLSSSLPFVSQNLNSETMCSSLPDFALNMQKQLRDQNKKFEEYEARFSAIESIIQENIKLKEHTTALEQQILDQANLIKELEQKISSNIPRNSHDNMDIDTQPDRSTNASIWAKAPATQQAPTQSTNKNKKNNNNKTTTPVVGQKKATPGMTAAQVVALNLNRPLKKKAQPKKITAEAQAQAARPFVMQDADTPQGFTYVYLGRSRKITRAETRKRFKLVGVDTSRILDITFPATGVIGVLVHVQYAPVFTEIMTRVGAGMIKDFDPLDPKHLADPRYTSFSDLDRAQIAFDINANRCIHALLFLHNTKPFQVRPVGYSMVELGYISEEELFSISSVPKQDPKLKINSEAAKLFNYHPQQAQQQPQQPQQESENDDMSEDDESQPMQQTNKEIPPQLNTSVSGESL